MEEAAPEFLTIEQVYDKALAVASPMVAKVLENTKGEWVSGPKLNPNLPLHAIRTSLGLEPVVVFRKV